MLRGGVKFILQLLGNARFGQNVSWAKKQTLHCTNSLIVVILTITLIIAIIVIVVIIIIIKYAAMLNTAMPAENY